MCPGSGNDYAFPVAALNKRKSLPQCPESPGNPDVQDLFGLHFQASRRVDEILEEVQELQSAGKIPEAKALLKHAEGIQQGLRALEAEVRTTIRKPK
jgi:hypothetical protein